MSRYYKIAIDNTSYYLKNTFDFIQQYQVAENGDIFETFIYLKINLLDSQITGSYENRISASNTVWGYISYVGDTYVVILAQSSDGGIYSEYTINYSNIIEVINNTIYENNNLYKEYMECLSDICVSKEGKYLELYENLKIQIKEYNNDNKYAIQLIFAEVNSRIIKFSEIDIVKNLIIIDKEIIIPLTIINGFIIIPKPILDEGKEEGDE